MGLGIGEGLVALDAWVYLVPHCLFSLVQVFLQTVCSFRAGGETGMNTEGVVAAVSGKTLWHRPWGRPVNLVVAISRFQSYQRGVLLVAGGCFSPCRARQASVLPGLELQAAWRPSWELR